MLALLGLVKIVILALCIMIVAIPEGLPLAVSIAMALSINKLKQDQILIKNVDSIQTAAMVHDICVGKTGTMTTGKMNVTKYQFCDQIVAYDNDYPDKFSTALDLQQEIKTLIKESISGNSDVRLEPNDCTISYEPQG